MSLLDLDGPFDQLTLKLRTLGAARRVRDLARGRTGEQRLQWY